VTRSKGLNLLVGCVAVVVIGLLVGVGALIAYTYHLGTETRKAAASSRPAKVLEAEEFRLVDARGRTLASLSSPIEGTTSLAIHGKPGTAGGIGLAMTEDGVGGLTIGPPEGKPRAVLSIMEDGTVSLALSDQEGEDRANVTVLPEGKAVVALANGAGKSVWAAPPGE
jgi:hypothetical protein